MRVHLFYKFLIVFLFCFTLFFIFYSNMSRIVNSSMYKDYVNFISVPFNFINRYNIFKYKSVLEERDALRMNNLDKSVLDSQNRNLISEIESLKKEMELRSVYTKYDSIFARTVTRNRLYWFNTLTIDKGFSDGVSVGDCVINSDGLVGSISSVTGNHSTVKLISREGDGKISTIVKSFSDVYGFVVGYDAGYLLLEVSDGNQIKAGDKVYTSGLGNFPKNIFVGKVFEVSRDEFGLSYILKVNPGVDINNINYVAVLK